nr:DJ-1/PfpI family protein [Frankia sp. AgB32]
MPRPAPLPSRPRRHRPARTRRAARGISRGRTGRVHLTGAFVLAQAGLLDGRTATTYWARSAEFTARFPTVDLRPDVLYVEEGNVLTSAGLAAGIDLCLHLVRVDYDAPRDHRPADDAGGPPQRPGDDRLAAPAPGEADRPHPSAYRATFTHSTTR